MTSLIERIAIVGLGIRLPGAGADTDAFWAAVVAGTDCSREVPPGRWWLPPEQCHDPRVANPDTTYSSRGYYLDPFTPDATGLALDSALIAELDPLFHIILDAGTRAWQSAKTHAVDRSRVGVILGNICLPTARANALCREYLGGKLADWLGTAHEPKTTHPLNRYVAGLPAGVLAKALGLGGARFTLDAACASSLYAIKLATDELRSGRADVMLAGGANGSDCQYTQMGFAQLRALSASGRCSPFDARADGLMVGEGAAVFVLKRLSDALRDGETIHATIAGIGLSNDMHGNLLAPAKEGQLRAMRRAYEQAGWSPHDVELIECHATGTPVGDAVEFESLRELWGESGWEMGRCTIGSVKSTVGHLLTGAGAAAVTKVLRAMAAGVLPPQANFESPAPGLEYADGPFRVQSVPQPWDRRSADTPRRAAVSGFGFGGVNAHLLLEEWLGQSIPTARQTVLTPAPLLLITPKPRQGATPSARESVPKIVAPLPVAVVGMAAHFGPWADLQAFQERVLAGTPAEPAPKQNGWGLADQPCPPGFFIEELHFPIDRFRIPPKELEETLPQQLLMLRVAAAALDDCQSPTPARVDDPTTGVFIGLGLDLNTTNYHLRWSILANDLSQSSGGSIENPQGSRPLADVGLSAIADLASSPLSANRVMGALGSIAASRIARAFHFGGPSHTVCSEEASAARAVELAVRALRAGELDRAVAGGVELTADPRTVLTGRADGVTLGEGAAALILKRLADAERDGDRVYAIITGLGAVGGEPGETLAAPETLAAALSRAALESPLASAIPFDAEADIGRTGAATAAASLVKACLSLYQEILPGERNTVPRAGAEREGAAPAETGDRGSGAPCYWLHDRANGPRRAAVTAAGSDGSCLAFVLEEYLQNAAEETPAAIRRQPLGARDEAVFVVEGGSPAELVTGLGRLAGMAAEQSSRNIEAVARTWFRSTSPDSKRGFAVGLVARSVKDVRDQVSAVTEALRANPTQPLPADPRPALRDRVFFAPKPLGPKAKVAFVFPGSGNQFDGMGRDLGGQWPDILRRQQRENDLLRSQFAPDVFWDGRANEACPRDLMFGQVTVGSLVADILAGLGVRCGAMIGISLGESAGLFGVRAWPGRDEMFRRMQVSPLFNSDLAPPYNTARTHWSLPAGQPVDWTIGVIAASVDDVTAALRPGLKAYLLIINTPTECVIGGHRDDVRKLAAAIERPFFPLEGVTVAHCEVGKPAEMPYRDLHTLPVSALKGVTIYSGAWGKSYPVTERSAADSITAGLLNSIDVPSVVQAAYRDGVRVFLEVGPGSSCTRMIDVILAERPHLARAAHAGRQDAVSQILRVIANLAAERVPVDLAALYGRETRCLGHQEKAAIGGPVVIVPVGNRPPVSPRPHLKDSPQPAPHQPPSVSPEDPVVVSVAPSLAPMPPEVIAEPSVRTEPEPDPEPVFIAPSPVGYEDRVSSPPAPMPTLPVANRAAIPSLSPAIVAACDVQVAVMQAHETFLRVNQKLMDTAAGIIRFQTGLLERWIQNGEQPSLPQPTGLAPETEFAGNEADSVPRTLTYEQCCAFAAGRVADALGPLFAEVDSFPTRVRLPDGPLQLVDRITRIEGEPKSMTHGRVVTEHTVRPDRWYLEAGRIPTAIAVEAGQADLFLSGFLGIDFRTRGLAVYRLLDAVVSFHRGLPKLGETAVYDIHIDEFVKQGDAWIFRFRFDGTVGGEPFITMRNGVAGFFTAVALAAGKGIVQTALDQQRLSGKKPDDWRDLVPLQPCSLTAADVDALRRGDLVAAFGGEFAGAALADPVKLPGGMLRLVDRVPTIDPTGGRFGIGFVRAEFDIHPDDWFLTCHFVDDRVMPGTLMYECCLHTLRIFLMRMGWVAEAGEAVCEPVPGVNSRLKCRGQVLDSTTMVTYEVTVKELGYRPEPYCLADALMYADGKPIVEITNMSLRMTGLSEPRLRQIWVGRPQPEVTISGRVSIEKKPALYDCASILAFSNGKPSEAFGEPYRVFDAGRVIARLPGPPYQFIDRITAVSGEPFVLRSGASCEGQYDIPPDAWYFEANCSERMPFSILLEIALQPCGWLAAYCGSALTSPDDLSFRNLGGKATQFLPVTAQTGTLTMTATMTNVSQSAGMIIQHYDMRITSRAGTVYEGTTYFGFFAKAQLANQVGIREAKVPWPSDSDVARAVRGELPHDPPFPAPMLRMVDQIEAYLPDGGSQGLGLVVGRIAVDPEFWFFKAHFFQDPVWPGSLGLESFLQLLKYVAWQRWGSAPVAGWQTVALNRPHSWSYRGQVIPVDKVVSVVLEVTAVDDDARRLTANGFLTVDGRVIYQMTDFTLE